MNPDLVARLPLAATVVLGFAVAYQLADATWAVFAPQPVADDEAIDEAVVNRAPPDIDAIAGAHLFGTADVAASGPARTDAPETRLDLTLRGISASSSSRYARALIAGPDGEEKVYAVGGEVPGGARVHEIHEDRVLLNRRGTLETLRLPKFTSDGSAVPEPPAVERVGAVAVDNLRNQAVTDELVEVVRPQAVMVNGELRGFRVYPGRDRQRFAQLGLRAGDLVTGINGAPLSDMTQSLEAMRALTSGSEVTLTVQRGDETQTVTVRP